MRVLIIIPAYNEQETIENVIKEVKAAGDYDYVVVNDCSTDNTAEILRRGGYNHLNLPVNLGIGGGVQTGFQYAVQYGYDIAIQLDGDGQHDPAYLADIIAPVARGECDMCIGSRFIKHEGFQTSFMRRLGINILKFLIRVCCGARVTDTTSGFRAVNADVAAHFAAHYAQDYPEPESIISAVSAGYSVVEVPVKMRERQGGKTSISPLKSAHYMIKVSIAIVLYRLVGVRKKKKGDDK